MQEKQHVIYAGVFVEQDGKILLLQHIIPGKPHYFQAPRALVEGNETLRHVAQRAVFQQCGLLVEPRELLYVEEVTEPVHGFRFWFAGSLLGGEATTDHLSNSDSEEVLAVWLDRKAIDHYGERVSPLLLPYDYWPFREQGFTHPRYLIMD